jgi:hypothetical protein
MIHPVSLVAADRYATPGTVAAPTNIIRRTGTSAALRLVRYRSAAVRNCIPPLLVVSISKTLTHAMSFSLLASVVLSQEPSVTNNSTQQAHFPMDRLPVARFLVARFPAAPDSVVHTSTRSPEHVMLEQAFSRLTKSHGQKG